MSPYLIAAYMHLSQVVQNLFMSLVNETLRFQKHYTQKILPFSVKIIEELLRCKRASQVFCKNIATTGFVSAVRLNESSTNDFVKITRPR